MEKTEDDAAAIYNQQYYNWVSVSVWEEDEHHCY